MAVYRLDQREARVHATSGRLQHGLLFYDITQKALLPLRRSGPEMLEEINHQSFESLVGETVDLKAGDVNFQADIKSVKLLRQNPGQGRQSFSVELQAHDETCHPQQMYQLSHSGLGDLNLFIVPVGPDERGMCYEIVFN